MNDSLRTATNLGTFSDSHKTTFGDVRSPGDINDFFKFQLSETSTLTASLSNLQSDADLHLIKDGNDNGVVDSGDVIVNSIRGGTSTDLITVEGLVSGQYFLRVNKFGSGSTRYTLDVRSISGLGNEIESMVTDLGNINASRFFKGTALTNFEDGFDDGFGQADFRITTMIDDSSPSSRKFNDRNDVFADFYTKRSVSPSKRFVPFSINVTEEDLENNDPVNISPSFRIELHLTYDTLTGRINGEGFSGLREGNLITSEGKSRDSARVQLRVNYRTFS